MQLGGIAIMINNTSRKWNNGLRCIAMFLVITIFAVSTISFVDKSSIVYANSEIEQLEAEIAKLEKENKELSANMNDVKGKIKDEESRQHAFETQISNTEKQITLFNQKIQTMQKNIEKKNEEIKLKSVDIQKNEDLFAQRVRAMYISGSTSMLTTVLSAESFSEFLTRSEILKRISQSDQDLIDTLSEQKEDLSQKKADMEKQNQELNATKTNLTTTSKSLEGLKAQSEKQKAALEKAYEKYYADKKANKKKIDAQEAEVARIIAASKGGNTAPSGAYAWPVPSSSRITSPYGYRYWGNQKEFHTGIDIGAPAGTSIVAANPGTVILVRKQNYGYGWYVVIDHGGGHATLYAHTSRIDVNEGDTVTRGQTIAGVGTTGNSTGNHLHFEVRINGAKNDPMGFVKKPS